MSGLYKPHFTSLPFQAVPWKLAGKALDFGKLCDCAADINDAKLFTLKALEQLMGTILNTAQKAKDETAEQHCNEGWTSCPTHLKQSRSPCFQKHERAARGSCLWPCARPSGQNALVKSVLVLTNAKTALFAASSTPQNSSCSPCISLYSPASLVGQY